MYDGQSRGFAFVQFDDKESAEKAKKELNYTMLENREMTIWFKKPHSEFKKDGNIFVNSLPTEFTV